MAITKLVIREERTCESLNKNHCNEVSRTKTFLSVSVAFVLLPERHGKPHSHQHECGPFVFWIEAGQEVTPHLLRPT